MNWFAIGAGAALVIAAALGFARKPDGSSRLSRPVAITLGLAGLVLLYVGGMSSEVSQ